MIPGTPSVRNGEEVRPLTTLAVLSATALLAAGCGDDGPSSSSPSAGGGGAGEENLVEVTIEGVKYLPMQATVPAGGAVKWTNSDTPSHTVTYVDGPGESFDSGTLAPGDGFEQKFNEPGTVSYVCKIHPFQKGTITIE